MVALEQRYCNRKPRSVMARPGESLKNNNAEIWRETHSPERQKAQRGPAVRQARRPMAFQKSHSDLLFHGSAEGGLGRRGTDQNSSAPAHTFLIETARMRRARFV